MNVYYNEIDPFPAAWLKNLGEAGHLPAGVIDTRSIADVQPSDLAGFDQCHFFAGIGGWPYALQLAGWPDDFPVWTGSCPCQPFSIAGRKKGTSDERHLWPEWLRLIKECRPATLYGEQVASPAGRAWLAAVRADLENLGYRVAAVDLGASCVGAPHQRQRLFFAAVRGLADSVECAELRGIAQPSERPVSEGDGVMRSCGRLDDAEVSERRCTGDEEHAGRRTEKAGGSGGSLCSVENTGRGCGRWGQALHGSEEGSGANIVGTSGALGGPSGPFLVGDTVSTGLEGRTSEPADNGEEHPAAERTGGESNPWADCEWIYCRDGKYRPVKPGIHPLASRLSARVGQLRAYGNAIVPQVAAVFIRAVLDELNSRHVASSRIGERPRGEVGHGE